MIDKKYSFATVSLALVVILIGLFLVCAQQRGAFDTSDDLSAEDEAFRRELMDMLDLADEGDTGTGDFEGLTEEDLGDDTEDVLSLLAPSDSETAKPPLETEPTTTTETMGISEEMFMKIRTEVRNLENILDRRSSTVDSLQRIIENRNGRIRDLETRIKVQESAAPAYSSGTPSAAGAEMMATSGFMASYQAARNQFESYNYQGAIQSFNALLEQYPSHVMRDNCQYWIGECYFGMKQYQKAIMEFQKVFAYSQDDKYDDAQLMVGLSYVRLGQNDQARTEFETFLNNYAGSEYTGVAQRYMRNI
jgi:tol-pal system protein YbgF